MDTSSISTPCTSTASGQETQECLQLQTFKETKYLLLTSLKTKYKGPKVSAKTIPTYSMLAAMSWG